MTESRCTGPARVLLTGAAGFVGRYVLAALLKSGYHVVALQHRAALPLELEAHCERVLAGDLRNPGIRQEALRDVQCICHLAAYIPARLDDLKEAAECYQVNAEATLELALAAAECGIRRFVYFSTGNMYAPSGGPCSETDSVSPTECAPGYFVSKLAAELYLLHVSKRSAMQSVILRIGTPYGPGEPSQKVIPTFLRLAAQRQPLRMVNGGATKFNFVSAADLADCAVRALENGSPGIYNLSSGEHTSIRELAQAVVEMFGEPKARLQIEPATPVAFPGFAPLSIDKARKTWGFQPRSLATGLREYQDSLAKDRIPA